MKPCSKCKAQERTHYLSWCRDCLISSYRKKSKTPEHRARQMWCHMKNRTTRKVPKNSSYKHVRLKITRPEFIAFAIPALKKFISKYPNLRPTIDRIDGDGHYELGNIRVISQNENSRNKKRNHRVHAPKGFSWCSPCQEFLPIPEFNINKSSFHGFSRECKSCVYLRNLTRSF